jgi:hypothetical protein
VTLVGVSAIFTGINEIFAAFSLREAGKRAERMIDRRRRHGPALRDRRRDSKSATIGTRNERSAASHTDRSRAGPARRGAERSCGPGRLVGGAQQTRSHRPGGSRHHANPHVGPRLWLALPGRRPLEAVDRECRSPGDRRRSGWPPRRGQRPSRWRPCPNTQEAP